MDERTDSGKSDAHVHQDNRIPSSSNLEQTATVITQSAYEPSVEWGSHPVSMLTEEFSDVMMTQSAPKHKSKPISPEEKTDPDPSDASVCFRLISCGQLRQSGYKHQVRTSTPIARVKKAEFGSDGIILQTASKHTSKPIALVEKAGFGIQPIGTGEESNHTTIDVEKLSELLPDELRNMRALSENCCIYRVSNALHELNKTAYSPQLVSIGPIHHGKPKLKAMEEHKRRYLHDFLLVTGTSLQDYVGLVEKKETRLLDCYAELVELNSADFVKMVLLDSIFIIMFLLKFTRNFETLITSDIEQRLVTLNDRLFGRPNLMGDVRYDMILLENQLPFFILEDIFNLSKVQDFLRGVTMIELACGYLNDISRDIKKDLAAENFSRSNVEHLLHFLVVCFTEQESEWQPKRKEAQTLVAASVNELYQSGVEIKPGSEKNIFEIIFKNGILEIPPLTVTDKTELLFRNLMAYEQYHDLKAVFADYIMVMHQLVNRSGDVELLVKEKIFGHMAGGIERTSDLFNKLGTENLISEKQFVYSDLIAELNSFYEKPRHKWMATLKQKYFKTPWVIFSVLAAGAILVLTILQTVCSFLQVT